MASLFAWTLIPTSQLTTLTSQISTLIAKVTTMSATVAAVSTKVDSLVTAVDSLIGIANMIKADLDAAGSADSPALQAISDKIDAELAKVNQALTADAVTPAV